MKNTFTRLLFATCMVVFSFTTLLSQSWTLLGSCKVHGQRDYDEISVTASQGDFKAIKLFVENEAINFDRVVVHYKNGSLERMVINTIIPAGGETRVMDLAGGDRVIRKVSFYYKSKAMTSTKGKVVLYGKR